MDLSKILSNINIQLLILIILILIVYNLYSKKCNIEKEIGN